VAKRLLGVGTLTSPTSPKRWPLGQLCSDVKVVARRASFAVALVTGGQRGTSPAWPGLFGGAGQGGQYLAERGVDLDVGERVAPSRAPVDDRHRDPLQLSPVHEPQP
jgi:hypothetical protein